MRLGWHEVVLLWSGFRFEKAHWHFFATNPSVILGPGLSDFG